MISDADRGAEGAELEGFGGLVEGQVVVEVDAGAGVLQMAAFADDDGEIVEDEFALRLEGGGTVKDDAAGVGDVGLAEASRGAGVLQRFLPHLPAFRGRDEGGGEAEERGADFADFATDLAFFFDRVERAGEEQAGAGDAAQFFLEEEAVLAEVPDMSVSVMDTVTGESRANDYIRMAVYRRGVETCFYKMRQC